MKLIVLFGVLTAVFFLLFLYYLDLLLFYFREKKAYLKKGDSSEYLQHLEKKHKRKKHPQKKNFLLYLICLTLVRQKSASRAKNLLPFLKKDILLGVEKGKEADL